MCLTSIKTKGILINLDFLEFKYQVIDKSNDLWQNNFYTQTSQLNSIYALVYEMPKNALQIYRKFTLQGHVSEAGQQINHQIWLGFKYDNWGCEVLLRKEMIQAFKFYFKLELLNF